MLLPNFTAGGIKKLIIYTVVAVIMGEIIWAGWVLTQPAAKVNKKTTTTETTQDIIKPASLAKASLTTTQKEVKVGQNFLVNINISSSRLSDGADLIIHYDKSLLEVVTSGKPPVPVKPGNTYNEYLFNELDKDLGIILVSAVNRRGEATLARGVFGSITFKAKASGQAKIDFDFTSVGSTQDSNVIESKTAKDLLGEVENLRLTIVP